MKYSFYFYMHNFIFVLDSGVKTCSINLIVYSMF